MSSVTTGGAHHNGVPAPGTDQWLAQVREEIVEPGRPVIDPHHHLWKKRFNRDYLLQDLWKDTGSGHCIVKTVFMECRAFYLRQGPEHLMPAGETAYIGEVVRQSRESPPHPPIAGVIGHADLTLGGNQEKQLHELLDRHEANCHGAFRGIRHPGAYDHNPEALLIRYQSPIGLYRSEAFRSGLRVLAKRGLTYDAWHYHHQNVDFLEMARAVPECTMILDHFGTPLGVGHYRGCRDEVFRQWKEDMAAIARCPNVYAKLGGLAMPDNGFGWDKAQRPPSSDEFVARQKKYYLHTIECFGPERCMFESNFPVDRLSLSYHVLWNGFKKMVADFSEREKHALFYGTAEKVYRLG